jgi:hypothetical protein
MPTFSGTCSSKVSSQTTVGVPGPLDRQLALAVLLGRHKSTDPKWMDARFTLAGTTDVVQGRGEQRGYFHNARTNGDTSHGTFEAKVTTALNATMTVAGTWRFVGGTGTLANLSGGGIFTVQMATPTDSEMTWSGSYGS